MDKLLHTPGPWQVSWNTFYNGEGHGIYADGEMDLKGWHIAVVNYWPTMDARVTEETGKANARLIAAAPDLLKAAIESIATFEVHDNSVDTKVAIRKLKQAIKKATK